MYKDWSLKKTKFCGWARKHENSKSEFEVNVLNVFCSLTCDQALPLFSYKPKGRGPETFVWWIACKKDRFWPFFLIGWETHDTLKLAPLWLPVFCTRFLMLIDYRVGSASESRWINFTWVSFSRSSGRFLEVSWWIRYENAWKSAVNGDKIHSSLLEWTRKRQIASLSSQHSVTFPFLSHWWQTV